MVEQQALSPGLDLVPVQPQIICNIVKDIDKHINSNPWISTIGHSVEVCSEFASYDLIACTLKERKEKRGENEGSIWIFIP